MSSHAAGHRLSLPLAGTDDVGRPSWASRPSASSPSRGSVILALLEDDPDGAASAELMPPPPLSRGGARKSVLLGGGEDRQLAAAAPSFLEEGHRPSFTTSAAAVPAGRRSQRNVTFRDPQPQLRGADGVAEDARTMFAQHDDRNCGDECIPARSDANRSDAGAAASQGGWMSAAPPVVAAEGRHSSPSVLLGGALLPTASASGTIHTDSLEDQQRLSARYFSAMPSPTPTVGDDSNVDFSVAAVITPERLPTRPSFGTGGRGSTARRLSASAGTAAAAPPLPPQMVSARIDRNHIDDEIVRVRDSCTVDPRTELLLAFGNDLRVDMSAVLGPDVPSEVLDALLAYLASNREKVALLQSASGQLREMLDRDDETLTQTADSVQRLAMDVDSLKAQCDSRAAEWRNTEQAERDHRHAVAKHTLEVSRKLERVQFESKRERLELARLTNMLPPPARATPTTTQVAVTTGSRLLRH